MENTAMLNSGIHNALDLFGNVEEFFDEILYDNQMESEAQPDLKIEVKNESWGIGTCLYLRMHQANIPERYQSFFQSKIMNISIDIHYFSQILEGKFPVHYIHVQAGLKFNDIDILVDSDSITLGGKFSIFRRIIDINRMKKRSPIPGDNPLTFQALLKKRV